MERASRPYNSSPISALARVSGRTERVRVLDFSLEECKIVTSFGFVAPGEAILLTIGAIRLFGDVSRQDSREATVKFRARLHPAIVAHIGFGSDHPRTHTLAERVRRVAPTGSRASILKGPQDAAAFFDMPAEWLSAGH